METVVTAKDTMLVEKEINDRETVDKNNKLIVNVSCSVDDQQWFELLDAQAVDSYYSSAGNNMNQSVESNLCSVSRAKWLIITGENSFKLIKG